MTLVQIAKDEGNRSEQLAREVLPVYDFDFFVNQSKLHRGWDFTRAKEMWDGFDTDDNFGDYGGPPYAKKTIDDSGMGLLHVIKRKHPIKLQGCPAH